MKSFLAYFPLILALLGQMAFAQSTPVPTGLVAYWPFNEGTGTTAANAVSSSHAATLVNGPAWSNVAREGNCLEMVDNQARRAAVSSLTWQPAGFTVSFWLNPYSFNTNSHLIMSAVGWGGFVFHTDTQGGVNVGTDLSTRLTPAQLPAGTVERNKWQHFTFTYNGGTGQFYKNGRLLATKAGMTASTGWGGFTMGNADVAGALHGKLDEVRIYDRALNQSEVQTLAAWPSGPVSSTWNPAAASTDWNNPANWLEGYAPVATTEVTINACTTCPALPANTSVYGMTMQGGTLQLNGYTLSITGGNALFYRGTVSDGTASTGAVTASGPVACFGTSSGGSRIEVPVTVNSASITMHYTTFTKALTVTRTGNVQDLSTGGNVFHGVTSITNAGSKTMALARYAPNIYNQDVTLSTTGNSDCMLAVAHTMGNQFNGNLIVNSNVTSPTWATGIATEGPAGSAVLAEGKQIQVGSIGMNNGSLRLAGFTQRGSTTQLLTERFPATMLLGPFTEFYGELNYKGGGYRLDRCTFYGVVRLERIPTGGTISSAGGNVFHQTTYLTNTASAGIGMGVNYPDTFKSDLYLTQTGAGDGRFEIAVSSSGTEFGGNVILNNVGPYWSWQSITLGGSYWGKTNGTCRLAAGKQLKVGELGISGGFIKLQNFAQAGTAPQEITASGTGQLMLGHNTVFDGPVHFTAPRIFLDGATYNSTATFIKTNNMVDNSVGGNVFRGKVTIRNQGPAGAALNMATQVNDLVLPPPSPAAH